MWSLSGVCPSFPFLRTFILNLFSAQKKNRSLGVVCDVLLTNGLSSSDGKSVLNKVPRKRCNWSDVSSIPGCSIEGRKKSYSCDLWGKHGSKERRMWTKNESPCQQLPQFPRGQSKYHSGPMTMDYQMKTSVTKCSFSKLTRTAATREGFLTTWQGPETPTSALPEVWSNFRHRRCSPTRTTAPSTRSESRH